MKSQSLVSQPTVAPSRKMTAVILATFIVHGAIAVSDYFLPGISEAFPAAEWVAMLTPLFAGYMTRDRAA